LQIILGEHIAIIGLIKQQVLQSYYPPLILPGAIYVGQNGFANLETYPIYFLRLEANLLWTKALVVFYVIGVNLKAVLKVVIKGDLGVFSS
jgi:hypothetical protein